MAVVMALGVAAAPNAGQATPVHNTPICDLLGVVVTSQGTANATAFGCNFDGNDVQGDQALNELNGGFLAGFTDDWEFVGKSDDANSGVVADNGMISGDWTLTPGVTGVFAITLKAGNGFSAYGFNVDFTADGGTFNTGLAELGNKNPAALSHLSLFRFTGDVPPPPEEPPVPAPLPAAAWMLLAGLGGLFAMKRRRSAA